MRYFDFACFKETFPQRPQSTALLGYLLISLLTTCPNAWLKGICYELHNNREIAKSLVNSTYYKIRHILQASILPKLLSYKLIWPCGAPGRCLLHRSSDEGTIIVRLQNFHRSKNHHIGMSVRCGCNRGAFFKIRRTGLNISWNVNVKRDGFVFFRQASWKTFHLLYSIHTNILPLVWNFGTQISLV